MVGVFVLFVAYLLLRDPFAVLPFDRAAWLEDVSCVNDSNRRGPMAYDIVQNCLRKGMSRTEVEKLLGTFERWSVGAKDARLPDSWRVDRLPRVPDGSQNFGTYYLGEELGLCRGVNLAWLALHFDANDRYVDWRIWQP